MTEEKNNDQTAAEKGEDLHLYDEQIEKFRKAIEELGFEEAIVRYGFALFHSLPVEERLMYQREYKWVPDEPEDTYNLGNVHAMKDDLDEAIKLWEKALKEKPDLIEAIFNLGLAWEKKGDMDKARDYYAQYMESVEDDQEAERIEAHLSELNT